MRLWTWKARSAHSKVRSMMSIHRDAMARGAVGAPKRRRRPRVVKVSTVNPAVLREALRLAQGDASRLVIKPTGEVIVKNHGKGRPVRGALPRLPTRVLGWRVVVACVFEVGFALLLRRHSQARRANAHQRLAISQVFATALVPKAHDWVTYSVPPNDDFLQCLTSVID